MKPKSSQRNFKPINELPPSFKNLTFNHLMDNNPFGIQIAKNSQYTLDDFYKVLFLAGIKRISVPEAVKHLQRTGAAVPTAKTIWNNVEHGSLEEKTLEASNALITLPVACSKKVRNRLKHCHTLALDWTDLPFYGKKDTAGTIGGKRKKSTDHFYRHMSAEMVQGTFSYNTGAHLTVKNENRVEESVKLIQQARQRFTVKTVLADGAYFSGCFVGWLGLQELDYCIRAPLNRHLKKELSLVKNRLTTVNDAVFLRSKVFNRSTCRQEEVMVAFRRRGKGYQCHAMSMCPRVPYWELLKAYDRRFGIETGYRIIGKNLPPTCSKRPEIRVLLFFLAMFIANCWRLADLWLWPEYVHRTVKALHYRLTQVSFIDILTVECC